MPIRLSCPECDQTVRLDDRFAGRRVKCPKCQATISVPDEEDERPAPRKRSRPERDEEEKPRGRSAPRGRDEEDDRPRKRASKSDPDDDRDRDEPGSKKSKKKQKKGGGLLLWLGLGGGAVLLLGGCVCGGVLLFVFGGFGGGSISAESKYFPDDCESLTSERTDQIRKTKFHEATVAQLGDLASKVTMHGVKVEDVERHTNAHGGGNNYVHIVTTKRAMTPAEIKEGLQNGLFKQVMEFTEEKVGPYVLYVQKGPGANSFCLPESRIVVVGPADSLRKILQRDKRPQLSASFEKAFAGADFSSSKVSIGAGKRAGAGGVAGLQQGRAFPDASCTETNYGSDHTSKVTFYFKDSAAAEDARKEAEESLKKEVPSGREAVKEARKNARVRTSGSTLIISTSVREETVIKDMKQLIK